MSADAEKEDKQTRKKDNVLGNTNCRVCKAYLKKKPQNFNEVSINCDSCSVWFHAVCVQVDKGKHDAISKHNLHWFCNICEVGAGNLFSIISELKKEVEALKLLIADKEPVNSTDGRLSDSERQKLKREIIDEIKTDDSFVRPPIDSTPNLNTEQIKNDIMQELKSAPDRNSNPWNLPLAPNKEPPNLKDIVSDEVKELRELEKIKNNLVISGIPEDGDNDDMESVKNIIREELDIEAEITTVERCGKKRPDSTTPRPIKIMMSNPLNRRKILSKAKNLRDSDDEQIKTNVYIRPDQTRKQQEQAKNLRDQRRELLAANPGKNYVIRNNSVIEI